MALLEMESDLLKLISQPTENGLLQIGVALISEGDKQVLLGSQNAMVQIGKFMAALANDNRHAGDFFTSENVVTFARQFAEKLNDQNGEFVNTLALMVFRAAESKGTSALVSGDLLEFLKKLISVQMASGAA